MADSLLGMHKALGLIASSVKVGRAGTCVESEDNFQKGSHLPPCQGRVSPVFAAVLCRPG